LIFDTLKIFSPIKSTGEGASDCGCPSVRENSRRCLEKAPGHRFYGIKNTLLNKNEAVIGPSKKESGGQGAA
jgi:hypothetical protein